MTFPAIDSINTYGGVLTDYAPVADPTTDRPAAGVNKALATVAMMSHCAPRAIVQFTGHATTPVLNDHDAAWGDGVSVAPVVTVSGTGYDITFPSSITDENGDTQSVSLRWGHAQSTSASEYSAQVSATSSNVLHLNTFAAGVANLAAGVTFVVFAY